MTGSAIWHWVVNLFPLTGILAILGWLGHYILTRHANTSLERTRGRLNADLESVKVAHQKLIEELRHTHSRSEFAFSKQYEKEFSVYEQLWKGVVGLYSKAAQLRPMLDQIDPKQSESERKDERLKMYSIAAIELKEIVLYQRPFFSQEIFELSQSLYLLCGREATQYSVFDAKFQKDYYELAEKSRVETLALSEKICTAIRGRLREVEAFSRA